MTNEQIFSSVILKILIDVEERNMKMKRILAVLLALTVFVGLLPAMDLSVKAADAYLLSGIPENVDVTVDGVVVTTAGGSVSVPGGAAVGVSPAKGYEIKELEVQEVEPIGDTVYVTLDADDVWGDGSGYQMLLDADANTFGSVIPESGAMSSGDVSDEVYAEFEYKMPENADGALDTSNVLIGASQTIEVEPGTYDWCITNPTPGDRMWIASANGTVGGRADDFVFELGHSYDFHVYLSGSNDAVDLVDTAGLPGDYISVTDNGDGSYSFVMPSSDAQMKVTVKEIKTGLFYDFETDDQLDDWLLYDADGDGNGWGLYTGAEGFAPSGDRVLGSASWSTANGAMDADNWLILDAFKVPEQAVLSFWLANASSSYPDNLYVYIGEELDASDPEQAGWVKANAVLKEAVKVEESARTKMPVAVKNGAGTKALEHHMTQIGEEVYTPGGTFEEYTIDLSDYAGKTEYLAFRHVSYDMYAIYLDDVWIKGEIEEPAALEPTADDLADGTIQLVWDEIENAASYDVFSLDGGNQTLLGTAGPETVYVDTRDHKMGETYSFLVVAKYDNGDSICDGSVDDMFNPFKDVADDSLSFEYIAWAYNNEIVKGSLKEDGFRYFEPDGSTTRMNFVMILYKMHGSPKVSGKNPFKDVTGSKSVKAVLWAYNKGLVKGTDKTHFSPDVNLSRMNIIMILYKLAGSPKVSGDNPFADISGSKTIKAVLWAVQKGIITGVDDTHFEPDGDCSRALFVEVLYKYNQIYKILK